LQRKERDDDFIIFGVDFEIGVKKFTAFGFEKVEVFGEINGGFHEIYF
jgi:hypothetical protein